jgi:hypothetical protein
MITFARFSFLVRRSFFRLMHQDLNAIFDGLRELEQRGVNTIDCRRAQFSAEEPILRLRMICQSWKVMFQAEYSSGQPLRMLVDLRAAIDDALGRGVAQNARAAKPSPVKKAAAAPAAKPAPAMAACAGAAPSAPATKFNSTADAVPEFEVSGNEWNPDGSSGS